MPALLDAIDAASKAAPDGTLEVKRIVAGDDTVAVHSHVRQRPDEPGVSVVHMFRFEGDRIAELWDIVQPIPPDSPNSDGMF
jgi:predicted SnoaL-like aldol condensation-catalyzing enzyme